MRKRRGWSAWALGLWAGVCVLVLADLLWRSPPLGSAGGELAFLMFALGVPVSAAVGMALNAVNFGAWLPAGHALQLLWIWTAFFVPALLQWLALRWVWRKLRGR